ncbi:hypothetical protein [Streptococcus sciuri]|uniref:Uncharacterized protein n=1 Tax=Streptococcus sciuri TaxID=2973939 RepID=A0ABT2F7M5_9STRE|nr:hypothetical protein [Streptococcus sciuri]MCS4488375.1 hypothetical protein [Streptococcus sciuri]
MAEKHALMTFGWTLEEYENADYFRLMEVMTAKEAKDRPVDPLTFLGLERR